MAIGQVRWATLIGLRPQVVVTGLHIRGGSGDVDTRNPPGRDAELQVMAVWRWKHVGNFQSLNKPEALVPAGEELPLGPGGMASQPAPLASKAGGEAAETREEASAFLGPLRT